MKSIFLSHEQLFEKRLGLFDSLGAAAPGSDLALLTAPDDGFLTENGGGINYYLAEGACVDRFGRDNPCAVCAVRPAILLSAGEEGLLRRVKKEGELATAEFGSYPTTVLDLSLRDMAEREYRSGSLRQTGRAVTAGGRRLPVYQLGAKQIVCLNVEQSGANGYVRLSDGSVVSVALPDIGESLGVDTATSSWVTIIYMMVLAGLLVLFARIAADRGVRKVMAAGLAVFTVGSLLCGISYDFWMLIASRAFQAVGAAMMAAALSYAFGQRRSLVTPGFESRYSSIHV